MIIIIIMKRQDVSAEFSLAYPNLYMPGHMNLFFNKKVFALSVIEGIFSSLVLFFVPYLSFHNAIKPNGHDLAGHKAFGTIVSSSLIVTVTLRVRGFPEALLLLFVCLFAAVAVVVIKPVHPCWYLCR